jgi:hypothetical protein
MIDLGVLAHIAADYCDSDVRHDGEPFGGKGSDVKNSELAIGGSLDNGKFAHANSEFGTSEPVPFLTSESQRRLSSSITGVANFNVHASSTTTRIHGTCLGPSLATDTLGFAKIVEHSCLEPVEQRTTAHRKNSGTFGVVSSAVRIAQAPGLPERVPMKNYDARSAPGLRRSARVARWRERKRATAPSDSLASVEIARSAHAEPKPCDCNHGSRPHHLSTRPIHQ